MSSSRHRRARKRSLLRNLTRPADWPLTVRRAAILLFPLALPLWLALVALAVVMRIAKSARRAMVQLWKGKASRRRVHPLYAYGDTRRS